MGNSAQPHSGRRLSPDDTTEPATGPRQDRPRAWPDLLRQAEQLAIDNGSEQFTGQLNPAGEEGEDEEAVDEFLRRESAGRVRWYDLDEVLKERRAGTSRPGRRSTPARAGRGRPC